MESYKNYFYELGVRIMEKIFNLNSYSKSNMMYRWIKQEALEKYISNINRHCGMNRIRNILDIGCGTGQFSISIAEIFPDCHIDAIDISSSQIETLKSIMKSKSISNISCYVLDFMKFHLSKTFDVIILSEVLHLFDDLDELFLKAVSLLSNGGVIFIRTPTPAQIMKRKSYNYFPKCRYIDLSRCKCEELIKSALTIHGANIISKIEVDESVTISCKHYINGFKNKQYSTLYLISEKELNIGIEKMRKDLTGYESIRSDFEMTGYFIKKEL